jgi:glycosyltransferase involved in cell wall biosynthesis
MISIHMTTACRFKSGLLVKAIESVLSQDYEDFEFIICDDASMDGTQNYLLSLQSRDARVKVFRNAVNVNSVAVSLGRCFNQISPDAKYITWMFDDNVMRPEALTILVNSLREDDNLHFVYGTAVCHLKNGAVFAVGYQDANYVRANVGMSPDLVPNAGILIKREVFDQVGWYDASVILRRSCEWDLFNRMIAAGYQFKVISAELIDEFEDLEIDSLRNTFITTFDLMRKYVEFRDQAGWQSTLEEALYFPVDRIPPVFRIFSFGGTCR